MTRSSIIVLLALGATLAGFVLASNERRRSAPEVTPTFAARPQVANLDWKESYGAGGERLVFTADSIEVTESGWKARIGVANRTKVGWELAPGAIPDGSFGLQLFRSGKKKELDERNREGALPAARAATRFVPELPRVLEPNASWKGTISAHGPLVAGTWVRLVYGTLIAVGKPPQGFEGTFVWITDEAHELHE